ncbi:erythromycin esterase family protein [Spirillospora sp. CA-294931]|uniref:erythromycin esterase family protein n=1 Tax=Spirillospora sp. CA-294931 TaxID=3240042 RepID=UPI003D8D2570
MSLRTRRTLPFVLVPAVAGALAAAPARADAGPVTGAIDRHARPLLSTGPGGSSHDLRALGRMLDGAAVVGLGEATHNSREFFTMKNRVFQYLVREKGFRAFSQEVHIAAGLRIDDYVVRGKGDIRRIMNEEFQGGTRLWKTREYLALFEWMRSYNARHKAKLRYVGNDVDYPGEELFARVEKDVRAHHPDLLPALAEGYRGLRPTTDMETWMKDYPGKPLAERRALAGRADGVVALLRARGADATTVRYASFVAQVARLYSYDMADRDELLKAVQHRERAMADNTVWWNGRTGGRTLLSAHNGHVAYGNSRPEYPYRIQGDLIRERIGRRYVAIGFSFGRGGLNAFDPETGVLRPVTVGPPEKGSNEETLDRSRHRDYLLDMRTAPPVLRDWLARTRPTRDIGSDYPDELRPVALGTFYDVLIHLHRISPASLL